MKRLVFVTGFARGGTSWLRDCIAEHADAWALSGERVVFRKSMEPDQLRAYFASETRHLPQSGLIVNKAPANAPFLSAAAELFPESKFIFIMRDPRDVLVSHQRGNKTWMKGKNSDVKFMLEKVRTYYSGLEKAEGMSNVLAIRYEDLHQDFMSTLDKVFTFLSLDHDSELMHKICDLHLPTNLRGQTRNFARMENPDKGFRRGTVGEWSINLSESDRRTFKSSRWFEQFSDKHNYNQHPLIYRDIVSALKDAGAKFLNEGEVLDASLNAGKLNVVLQHDIDLLNQEFSIGSVLETLSINEECGVTGGFHFLPHDDKRYIESNSSDLLKTIDAVSGSSLSYVGLHLNAFEKFLPATQSNFKNEHPAIGQAEDYTHQMIHWYGKHGVTFKIATAHGYGRGKRLPNNRDTPQMTTALKNLGIQMFDTVSRPKLQAASTRFCALTDVGGFLKPRRLGVGGHLACASTYEQLPPGTLLRFLTHPGNYPVGKGIVLEARIP